METQNEIQKTESPQSPIERMAALVAHPDSKIDAAGMATLLDAQLKYEANEARKAYAEAMAAFKEDPPQIIKDRTVGYEAKGGTVGYSHASLGNVTTCINKALSAHGLTASWETGQVDGKVRVTCHITHVLGHRESTFLDAAPDGSGSKNPIQAIGSTVTYLQRYTLLALTGLATYDQDDDGNGSGKPPAKIVKPTEQEQEVIDAICAKLPPKAGMRPDAKKVAAICYVPQQTYPSDMKIVDVTVVWLLKLNKPEIYMPENRSQFEIDNDMPGDEDSAPDAESALITFKCNACPRTYKYGKAEGQGVSCECGKGTLEEAESEDHALREAEARAKAKFGKETEHVPCRYECKKCDREFDEPTVSGKCPFCFSDKIKDRQAVKT